MASGHRLAEPDILRNAGPFSILSALEEAGCVTGTLYGISGGVLTGEASMFTVDNKNEHFRQKYPSHSAVFPDSVIRTARLSKLIAI